MLKETRVKVLTSHVANHQVHNIAALYCKRIDCCELHRVFTKQWNIINEKLTHLLKNLYCMKKLLHLIFRHT